ncbi:uncharacterized protein FN964_003336 isoform 1-T1 [Alca torda]
MRRQMTIPVCPGMSLSLLLVRKKLRHKLPCNQRTTPLCRLEMEEDAPLVEWKHQGLGKVLLDTPTEQGTTAPRWFRRVYELTAQMSNGFVGDGFCLLFLN